VPQPDHVVKIPLPDQDTLPEDIATYFAKCEEKLGLVPNVLRAYTGNPDKFRAFSQFYNQLMLAPSGLSRLERELIAVTVSCANHCYYCLVAHGQAIREYSGDPELGEMIAFNYRVAPLDDRQRAMLDYAWKLTLHPMDVSERDRAALRAVGLDDQDIFDITDVASFFNYTNRMAHGLEMMPNPAYHRRDR